MRFQFNDEIAAFQLLIVIAGTIFIGIVFAYFINPNSIYLGSLPVSKRNFIQTYTDGKYDFIANSTFNKILSTKFDEFSLFIARKASSFFVTNSLMVGLNLLITIMGIVGYFRKYHKIGMVVALSSIVFVVYFVCQLVTFNEQVRRMSLSTLNDIRQLYNSTHRCSICYKSLKVSAIDTDLVVNMISFSLHSFECCGIKSFNDSMLSGEIPFTCCPRKLYATSIVATSDQCVIAKVYPPCYDKLSQFMIDKTMLFYIKLMLIILLILHLLYFLLRFDNIFRQNEFYKINGKVTEDQSIKSDLLCNKVQTDKNETELIKLSNNEQNVGHKEVINTLKEGEYELDNKMSSEMKRDIKSQSTQNLRNLLEKLKSFTEKTDLLEAAEQGTTKNKVIPVINNKEYQLDHNISFKSKMIRKSKPISTVKSLKDEMCKDTENVASIIANQQVTAQNEVMTTIKNKNYQENEISPESKGNMIYYPISSSQSLKDEVDKDAVGTINPMANQLIRMQNKVISTISNNKVPSESKEQIKSNQISNVRSLEDDINKDMEEILSALTDLKFTGQNEMIASINDKVNQEENKMYSESKKKRQNVQISTVSSLKTDKNKTTESMPTITADQQVISPNEVITTFNNEKNIDDETFLKSEYQIKSYSVSNLRSLENEMNKSIESIELLLTDKVKGPNEIINAFKENKYLPNFTLSTDSKDQLKSNPTYDPTSVMYNSSEDQYMNTLPTDLNIKKTVSNQNERYFTANTNMEKIPFDLNIKKAPLDSDNKISVLDEQVKYSTLEPNTNNPVLEVELKKLSLNSTTKTAQLNQEVKETVNDLFTKVLMHSSTKSSSIDLDIPFFSFNPNMKTYSDIRKKQSSLNSNVKSSSLGLNMKNSTLDPDIKRYSLDLMKKKSSLYSNTKSSELDFDMKKSLVDPSIKKSLFDLNAKSSVIELNKKRSSVDKNIKKPLFDPITKSHILDIKKK